MPLAANGGGRVVYTSRGSGHSMLLHTEPQPLGAGISTFKAFLPPVIEWYISQDANEPGGKTHTQNW